MNKVVSVNLNGRAYQIEDEGYTALSKYLDQAEDQLVGNPDREEIIADFEQAIAEKCDQILSANKTVVSKKEMTTIIKQMGPVGSDDEEMSASTAKPAKRLYLIKEGAMIGGVCKGIATYLNVDVTVVRLVAVILLFLTSGAAAAVYLVLMFVVPEAKTPEERAAAGGESFNSKALLETARRKYSVLGDKEHWSSVAHENRPLLNNVGATIRKLLRIVAGVIAGLCIMSLLSIVVAGVSGIWTLMFTGQFFDVVTLDPSISRSLLALFLASGLVVAAVPILLVTTICFRYAKSGSIKQNVWGVVSALSAFAVALGVGLAILGTTPQLRTVSTYHQTKASDSKEKICVGHCTKGVDYIQVLPKATKSNMVELER